MFSLITGFTASIAHVVTGPDHLAAVTPLAIDSQKKSWAIGLVWGIGHTVGMLLIGMLFILFKQFIPIESLSEYSETIIGLLLIGIGIWSIFRLFSRHSHHEHPHPHFHTLPSLYAHSHIHNHNTSAKHNHEHFTANSNLNQNILTSFSIGIFHGFAGFSHLIALLPTLAFRSSVDSILYLTAFALGTIITMVTFSFILGYIAFQSFIKDKLAFLKWFSLAGGIIAIGVGILWIIHPL